MLLISWPTLHIWQKKTFKNYLEPVCSSGVAFRIPLACMEAFLGTQQTRVPVLAFSSFHSRIPSNSGRPEGFRTAMKCGWPGGGGWGWPVRYDLSSSSTLRAVNPGRTAFWLPQSTNKLWNSLLQDAAVSIEGFKRGLHKWIEKKSNHTSFYLSNLVWSVIMGDVASPTHGSLRHC